MIFPRRLQNIVEKFDQAIRYEDCWAKTTGNGRPGINVRDHCLNVGCVAEALTKLMPHLRCLLPQHAATLAALHDLGKVSPGFQTKSSIWIEQCGLIDRALREGWTFQETDHAKISQYTVRELLQDSSLEKWAAVLGAHHGCIKGSLLPQPWEDERRRLARDLISQFGVLPDRPAEEAVLWFTAGLVTVADWIGSDEDYFPQDVQWDIDQRRHHASVALRNIGWRQIVVKPSLPFTKVFPLLKCANTLQQAVIQATRCSGVYTIEGPMGFGKTEAALAAAYHLMEAKHATGIYFGLPTQVTSNRIYERVQFYIDQICSDESPVRLIHSASWLVDSQRIPRLSPSSTDSEGTVHVQEGLSWFASSKRALLEPFGVGTIDQALLGVVAAKHFFVRQFGLAGKVVILDEVHTYDLYTSTLIDLLVKRLIELQCTVIILSATLTQQRRCELLGLKYDQPVSAAYPLVSGVCRGQLIERECEPPLSKMIQIQMIAKTSPVEQALKRAKNGECVLWIRNTVDDAQETYRALKEANCEGGPTIGLLHSRFPFFRREELESEWMSRLGKSSPTRPNGCVLVSTQVVEQSVDIDADLLLTDLAPTDMLLQRLGRLWRHERGARLSSNPEIWIQTPDCTDTQLYEANAKDLCQMLGKSARVYAPYILLRTLHLWRGRDSLLLPGDIRAILEATYADPDGNEPCEWKKLREQLEKKREKMARQALSTTNVWNIPALADDEGIQTRWNSYPSAQLLLIRNVTREKSCCRHLDLLNGESVEVGDEWNFDVAKAIHRNLTRIPRWVVGAFLTNPPRWLTKHVHQPTAVGILQTNGSVHALENSADMGLSYHINQGVIIHRKQSQCTSREEFDESFD